MKMRYNWLSWKYILKRMAKSGGFFDGWPLDAWTITEQGDNLNLLRGIPQKWQQSSRPLTIAPTHTRFGVPEIVVESSDETVAVTWKARWHTPPDGLFIRLTSTAPVQVESPGDRSDRIILSRNPDGG